MLLVILTLSDTNSREQPACHKEQNKWRNEDTVYVWNVMYNTNVCYAMYYNKILSVHWWEATLREKTLGETWAAVNKTINSILRTSVASNGSFPEWEQSRSQYMAEGDHEGRTHEVPQEDRTPSMYILNTCMLSVRDTQLCHIYARYDRCPFLV
jgi:hypothetical protein